MEAAAGHPKQLVIGLDAAEWRLVRRWADAGVLPTFRRLLEQGAHGILRTTATALPDTVWSCLYGGTNPAAFEKHFYVQYDPRTRDLRHVRDDAFTAEPFWDVLSRAGCRVGVIDAVKIPVSTVLNGFQIANWGAHATKTASASVPAGLLGEVERRFGRHPVGDCDAVDAGDPASLRDLRDRVLAGVKLRGRVCRWLMAENDWNVLFACFSEPHCIGHHFWHWLDDTHPRHAADDAHGLADAIERVYRAVDAEIGAMLELVARDTRVMIVAAHGMGPLFHASWNLSEILDLLGYGRGPARTLAGTVPTPARTSFWRTLKTTVPGRLQYAIKNALPQVLQDELLFRWYAGRRDWKGRRAFAVPNNDTVGAIRISVAGRDEGGVVDPAEYEAVGDDIAAALDELVDPDSGRKVVDTITFCHREYPGPFTSGLPDIAVLWDASFPWSKIRSPRFGTLAIASQDGRTGSHTSHGFVIVAGPGVSPGHEILGGSIYDVAPTILAASGVVPPSTMEGRSLAI